MTDREIMQQALTKLEHLWEIGIDAEFKVDLMPEIEALRQALAQPEQEKLIQFKDGKWSYVRKPWVGLTDDEIHEIIDACTPNDAELDELNDFAKAVRAAELRLKEKNGG